MKFLSAFVASLIPARSLMTTLKAEEEEDELVDPQEIIREKCKEEHCEKYKVKLDTCNDRVNSRSKTAETCFEEVLDLFHCVDHCAAGKLFSKLK